jgi:cell division protein FtsB
VATTRRPGGTPRAPRRAASSRADAQSSTRLQATRPAAAARGRRPSEELRTPRSVKGLAILASIFVVLAITLIPAVRSTLTQQGQINDLRARLAQQRQTVADLQREERQWSDPAYVEQQARERLKFVRVGERSYTVIDGLAGPDLAGGPQIVAPSKVSTGNTPWYGQLWQSIVIADTPAGVPVSGLPSPAPTQAR